MMTMMMVAVPSVLGFAPILPLHSISITSRCPPRLDSTLVPAESSPSSVQDDLLRERLQQSMEDFSIPDELLNGNTLLHEQQQQQQHEETIPPEDDDLDWFRFASIDQLYEPQQQQQQSDTSEGAVDKLEHSTVALVGSLARMGSWTAEALVRSGVGRLILVDLEDICVSQTTDNLNSLKDEVGHLQIDVLQRRLPQIRPTVRIDAIPDFVMEETLPDLCKQLKESDLIVDALPLESQEDADLKVAFWKALSEQEKLPKIISLGNPQGKIDPTRVRSQTLEDLAVNNSNKKNHKLWQWCYDQLQPDDDSSSNNALLASDITCVISDETPVAGAFGRECTGSVCFVSGTFGFVAAAKALDLLLGRDDCFSSKP